MTKDIRVVHVVNYDAGLRIHLGNQIAYQQECGYRLSAVTKPGNWIKNDTIILNNVPVITANFNSEISPLSDLKTAVKLAKYFSVNKFEIVHTHSTKPGLIGRIAAKMAKVPIIVHTVHGFYFDETMTSFKKMIYIYLEKLGASLCDIMLAQSRNDIKTALQTKICDRDKIVYIGNGIDIKKFDSERISKLQKDRLKEQYKIGVNEKVVGYVGRITRDKGVYEFLKATEILGKSNSTSKSVIVGFDNVSDSVKTIGDQIKCADLNDRVILIPFRDDIPEILSIIDVLVMPSQRREGLPRILMECAAMGKPVVATDRPGNREAIEDGISGLLVPMKNPLYMAKTIQKLLDNPFLANKIGEEGKKMALKKYDERNVFHRINMEYQRLIKNKIHN
jgi:glycosyltransferase involved in cell wall biosynthesis